MENLAEVKVNYIKVDENGKDKKVNETYLFDAVSFTESEARAHIEMEAMISGDFTIKAIKKANYSDVFPSDDADRWFKSKISFVSIDETSGKEKKVSKYILIMANDVEDACVRIKAELSTLIVPYTILSVAESPIVDFFPYFKQEEK